MFYLPSPYSHPAVVVRLRRFSAAWRPTGPADIGRHNVFSRIIYGHPMVLHGLPINLSFREQFDRDHLLTCDEVVVSIHVSWRNHIDRRIDSCGDECHRCGQIDGDPGSAGLLQSNPALRSDHQLRRFVSVGSESITTSGAALYLACSRTNAMMWLSVSQHFAIRMKTGRLRRIAAKAN